MKAQSKGAKISCRDYSTNQHEPEVCFCASAARILPLRLQKLFDVVTE
jgi:hypothetical protein